MSDGGGPHDPAEPGLAPRGGTGGMVTYWVIGAILAAVAVAVSRELSFVSAVPIGPCSGPDDPRLSAPHDPRAVCSAAGQWIMHFLPWIALALAAALFVAGGVLASTRPKARESGVHVWFLIGAIVAYFIACTVCWSITATDTA